eukprot:CAMPEP_0177207210 /NCGR_PEP_ID=MMETSP0367-20130122/29797_1 /TAXON_ID=447022 ORGANISM="Scrippsiella hangoei-like, Strain SHHI-4" /NCGR_SAMPLE_ID=MMETSP0367 /ASSEMBLY_ACC=CAM_ASM_000362 /LENGTH=40 /DNA_ID= /DNA_START= /DNA_END= /DNA_ORIENTATION=
MTKLYTWLACIVSATRATSCDGGLGHGRPGGDAPSGPKEA